MSSPKVKQIIWLGGRPLSFAEVEVMTSLYQLPVSIRTPLIESLCTGHRRTGVAKIATSTTPHTQH